VRASFQIPAKLPFRNYPFIRSYMSITSPISCMVE